MSTLPGTYSRIRCISDQIMCNGTSILAANGYVAVKGGNGGTAARKFEMAGYTLRNI